MLHLTQISLPHLADERLHDAALVRHVGDHGDHVVVAGPHQRGPEHDGDVAHVHLVGVGVAHHGGQVQREEPKRLVVVLWQQRDLRWMESGTVATDLSKTVVRKSLNEIIIEIGIQVTKNTATQ